MKLRERHLAATRRGRVAVTIVVLLALAATACSQGTAEPDGDPPARGQTLGDVDLTVKVGNATVTVPAGAVPAGTLVKATVGSAVAPTQAGGVDGLVPLADPLEIQLGDGIQPKEPLYVSIPVEPGALRPQSRGAVAFALESTDGTIDVVRARYDPKTKSVVGAVPHLSTVWPISFDLGALMQSVRDGILQGLGLEYPRPACEGKPTTVAGRTYSAVSPAQAWVCTQVVSGKLRVTASPNSAIPFLVTSGQPTDHAQTLTDVSISNALMVAVARTVGFVGDDEGFSMPGGRATFDYGGAPDEFQIGFRQYPAMLLLGILAKVLDVVVGKLDIRALEAMAKLECMQAVVEAGTAPGTGLSFEKAALVYKAFFPCVEPLLGQVSPTQRILLAIVSAGPQFLIASALGIVNELTGQGKFVATIDSADAPTVRTADLGLGVTAHFAYFDVTVHERRTAPNDVEGGGLHGVRVTVCYTRRHPTANADGRTRTSTDPWSFGWAHGPDPVWLPVTSKGSLLSDRWTPVYRTRQLAVGECNTGWITVDLRETAFASQFGARYAPGDFDFTGTWTWD